MCGPIQDFRPIYNTLGVPSDSMGESTDSGFKDEKVKSWSSLQCKHSYHFVLVGQLIQ